MLRCVVAAAVYVEISVGGRLSRHPLFQGFVLRQFICRDYYSKPFFVISWMMESRKQKARLDKAIE